MVSRSDTEQTLSPALAPPRNGRVRRLQVWLACAAFFYPSLWLSVSLMFSAPALTRVAVFGYRVEGVELRSFSAWIRALPAQDTHRAGTTLPRFELLSGIVSVVLILAAAALIAWLGRSRRILSGLALATLGGVGLVLSLEPVFFSRRITADALFFDACAVAVLGFGLRWMLADLAEFGYGWRLGNLFARFVLWPALLLLIFGFGWWSHALAALALPAGAAALASAWPVRASSAMERAGWMPVAWGVALSLLVVFGVHRDQAGRARAEATANQKIMEACPPIDPNAPYPKIFFQKGVNFTVEGPGGYTSDEGRQTLERLPQYGVNAVALVPYGFTRRGRSPTIGLGGWETDDVMRVGARVAHARGMKVMLKPAVWEAIDLQFSSAEERAKWFEQYQGFLEHYARLAKEIHADVLSVGGEFQHLTQYDGEWRKLIARARALYPGPLVYAANFGPEFETVTFWDALDYIGLQDYYPLPDELSMDTVVAKVDAVRRKYGKPVIFTEVGFPSEEGANRHPWDDSQPAKIALDLQARCYDAVFRAFYQKPWFEGMYWWKVGSNGLGGREDLSLTPWDKPAMEVVKRWYLQGGR